MASHGMITRGIKTGGYLDGQLLIAMPGMSDERFARTLIYLCAHSADGAMGLVINKPASDLRIDDLLRQLSIIEPDQSIRLPQSAKAMPILRGGPVETGRGFVLHSADFFIENSTLAIGSDVSLTTTLDILRAIAEGQGPKTAMLALGYAGWGAGQLESEIQSNGWLHCGADADLLFATEPARRYDLALRRLGINPIHLSQETGHA